MTMTMTDTFEELFASAEQNLKKQEIPDEWVRRRGGRAAARPVHRPDELPPFERQVFGSSAIPDRRSRST